MNTMTQEQKRQIRELMREKIRLEDLIQFEIDHKKIDKLEDELYEVRTTIDLLTNGVWFEDMDAHTLQKEREMIH